MEIAEVVARMDESEDILSVVQHHDGITGTSAEFVVMDYSTSLARAFDKSSKAYQQQILTQLHRQSGVRVKGGANGLYTCTEMS
jgi:hypothetical protein